MFLDEPSTVRSDDLLFCSQPLYLFVLCSLLCCVVSAGSSQLFSLVVALIVLCCCVNVRVQGIDPSARRFLWNVIATTMKGRCVMLTTQNLEECEALCHRVGIMNRLWCVCVSSILTPACVCLRVCSGVLRCLGTTPHLKQKYGNGYQLDINAQEGKLDDVRSFVARHFVSASILEKQERNIKVRRTVLVFSFAACVLCLCASVFVESSSCVRVFVYSCVQMFVRGSVCVDSRGQEQNIGADLPAHFRPRYTIAMSCLYVCVAFCVVFVFVWTLMWCCAEKELGITEYSVSEATLESIFLHLYVWFELLFGLYELSFSLCFVFLRNANAGPRRLNRKRNRRRRACSKRRSSHWPHPNHRRFNIDSTTTLHLNQ